jgi:putrescine transport system substrate-binding protein
MVLAMNRRTAAAAMLALLSACSGSDHQAPGLAAPDSTSPYDREKVLNVYSWADYIAPDTVANFERETGIKVQYDTYDNNEMLETKLLTGHTNYDVVIPTENFFDRQLRAGVYRRLDKGALPNLANADPEIMRRLAVHDPGNLYAIPYLWTTTGLAYNVDRVKARLGPSITDSWALLFDPANSEKLKDCGIAVIDSPLEVFQSAMIYLGRDPNRHDAGDLAAASELLRKIRPFIGRIEPDLIAPMASGDVCLSLAWSGDMETARNRAIEAAKGVHIVYFVPREGALLTVDMMAIPADAPHPRNAHAWMNYLLRPEVTAAISNYIKYPNGNRASLPYLDASIKTDPSIYPDAATRLRLLTNSAVSLDYSRLVTREWTKFRTGE